MLKELAHEIAGLLVNIFNKPQGRMDMSTEYQIYYLYLRRDRKSDVGKDRPLISPQLHAWLRTKFEGRTN